MTTPQRSLFDLQVIPPYHRGGTATERQAAMSVIGHAKTLRDRAYQWLIEQGARGGTRDELDQVLAITPNVTQPRLRELEQMELIRKTDRRRPTRSGRSAVVYVAIQETI